MCTVLSNRPTMWSVWVNSHIPIGRVFIAQKIPLWRISMNRFVGNLIYTLCVPTVKWVYLDILLTSDVC